MTSNLFDTVTRFTVGDHLPRVVHDRFTAVPKHPRCCYCGRIHALSDMSRDPECCLACHEEAMYLWCDREVKDLTAVFKSRLEKQEKVYEQKLSELRASLGADGGGATPKPRRSRAKSKSGGAAD